MMDVEVLTLDTIWHQLVDLRNKIILSGYKPDILIGIIRGGLPVIRLLSDLMEIKELATIGVGFYKDINQTNKEPILTQEISKNIVGKKILLIDDVSDSGKSLQFAVEYLKDKGYEQLKTATIHYKPHSIFKPDYFVSSTSKWLVYPWEYLEFTRLYFENEKMKDKSKAEIISYLNSISIPKEIIEIIQKEK
ncbi:MAG: phosphoribosyltransferase [Candidatus Thorarchaeota archaeon]